MRICDRNVVGGLWRCIHNDAVFSGLRRGVCRVKFARGANFADRTSRRGAPVRGQPLHSVLGLVRAYRRKFCSTNRLYTPSLRKLSGIAARIRRRIPRAEEPLSGTPPLRPDPRLRTLRADNHCLLPDFSPVFDGAKKNREKHPKNTPFFGVPLDRNMRVW
jgi:hypothetical protein